MSDKKDKINKKNEQDWSKVERTQDLVDYVYAKYGNSWKESDEATDEMLDDLYNFAMMKVCLTKYGKNLNFDDEIVDVILEDLRIKYGKDDKGKRKVDDLQNRVSKLEVDLAWAIKAKQVEHDKGKAKQAEHDLDDAKKAKQAEEAELKVNKGFYGDEDVVCFNDVKYPLTDVEIMMFKERLTTSIAPTRQLASTSTRFGAPSTKSRALNASTSTRSKAFTTSTSTRFRAPIASTSTFKASTRSGAPTASTSNAQAASTSAPRGYRKIDMTRCVLGLRAHDDPNTAPLSATRKRKSKK
ncbi:hypothetical protein Tco_1152956 [Tanacetum coccineum]